jgi:hypothetical protein
LAHQIRNYNSFTWLNGSFIVDWQIHNIDVCCWAKGCWPVAAQGQGGRQVREVPDQVFDHVSVEYIFPDDSRLFVQGRHMRGCWNIFSDFAHGTKGSARIMHRLGSPEPCIWRPGKMSDENLLWHYEGPRPNPYQYEHDLLFEAIRKDQPYNETERCVQAVMAAILGRMAAFSGQLVTWEQAFNSDLVLAPGVDEMSWDSPPPVQPDEHGRYPVAKPGITKAF